MATACDSCDPLEGNSCAGAGADGGGDHPKCAPGAAKTERTSRQLMQNRICTY